MAGSGRSKRCISSGAEGLIGISISVLDQGFVKLVDYMGNDDSIIGLIRRCYNFPGDSDQVINAYINSGNMNAFESASLVFNIQLPIYVMGQLVRHRTAKLNSFSGRYSRFEERFHLPSRDDFRAQSKGNKQVGIGSIDEQDSCEIEEKIKSVCHNCMNVYNDLIDMGLCRELARIVMPQNTYTVIYWKMDLKSLVHFLRLRCANDAQEEIRVYAMAIAEVFKKSFPVCFSVLDRMLISSISLNDKEIKLINGIK